MFGFLKSFFGGTQSKDSKEELLAVQSALASGIDIEAAIAAHLNWKVRLNSYLQGTSDEVLKPDVICFDNRCDLGKWIYSTGQERLGRFPGFTALVGHHKMFHYAASNVVSLVQSGKHEDARKMLKGSYETSSNAVIGDLEMMRKMVEKKV